MTESAHSIRLRRSAGSLSFGAPRATKRDIVAKSKSPACAPPMAAFRASGCWPGLGIHECRAKDVRELSLQMVELVVEKRCLARLDVPPGVDHEARCQVLVAIDQRAIDTEGLAGEREDLGHAFVRVDGVLLRSTFPQPGQGPLSSAGEHRAQVRARAAGRACAGARLRCPGAQASRGRGSRRA